MRSMQRFQIRMKMGAVLQVREAKALSADLTWHALHLQARVRGRITYR